MPADFASGRFPVIGKCEVGEQCQRAMVSAGRRGVGADLGDDQLEPIDNPMINEGFANLNHKSLWSRKVVDVGGPRSSEECGSMVEEGVGEHHVVFGKGARKICGVGLGAPPAKGGRGQRRQGCRQGGYRH